ncbi:MAG: RagB/SusD family nutrient uptake outer membrane protein [Bacteroidota bacterium]|nr:RagB/SusD family nutrient uptake outer membrane protein [Bacteroidota bacterium]
MKKYLLILALVVAGAGCKKADLQLNNPNSPTLASLKTKTGIEYYALGIFQKSNAVFDLPFFSSFIMGDEEISSVGNFGNRYQNQVTGITLPAPYNVTVPNIFGVTQTQQLQSLNNFAADAAGSNTFQYLWDDVYGVNGQANILLNALSTSTVLPANEKATLQAWSYWWKGIVYSMLGSQYSKGIISDAADGTTNSTYVTHDAIITEANANFDKAIAILSKIPDGDVDYKAGLTAVTPSFNAPDLGITPAMWIRNCYTMEARNVLVNIKLKDMTAANWATVSALAAKGLVKGDQAFSRGLDPNGVNDMTAVTQGHPFLWNNNINNPGWAYTSERFVQEFKTTDGKPVTVTSSDADGNILVSNVADARFAKGVLVLPTPVVNIRSRGIQFGSRWTPRAIEDGGYWTTGVAHLGQHLYTGSWEENTLMIAESNIHTGNIEAGLALVDKVRTEQGAGLTAVAGKGLTLAQAAEELRQERRIALYMRGVGFYDARRVGFTAPKSAGGGRANAIVLVPNSYTNTTGPVPLPCFIEYNYMDYWDVPIDETAYNVPTSKTSAN